MSTRMKVLSGFAAACMLMAPVAFGGTIVGSKHDFKGTTWGGGEVCKACHAPHNNVATTGLLWNHKATTATYTLYSSTSMQGTPTQLAGTSKLCMSCHDGTVGVDSFGGADTTNYMGTAGYGTTAANFGTNLANDHPVSFTYTTTNEELAATTTSVTFGDGSTGTIADMLDGGTQVECMSCHDVHNTKAAASTKLLLKSNANSGLCLTCHTK